MLREMRSADQYAIRVWLLASIAWVLVIGNSTVSSAAATADKPSEKYWFRNSGAAREQGEIDPRLAEALAAFGAGRYEECRKLAQDLISASDDSSARAECVVMIILSHLHQGDFAAAREAAERLRLVSPEVCQDLLAQVNREDRDYNAEVTRLQRIAATTKDPAEAARAQLWTGHAHQRAGLLEPAQQCYWQVVSSYPGRPEARSALFQMVELYRLHSNPKGAVMVCKMAIDLAPDGDLAVRACEVIRWLGLMHEQASHEETRAHLRQIAEEHAGTRAADTARFYIGELCAAAGLSEQAEEEWAALLAERPNCQIAPEVRPRLADLRYTMGTRAFFEGDFGQAAQSLERLLPDIDLIGHRSASGRLLDDARTVASTRRLAVFSLGEAYQRLGRWEEAAGAFERLAVPGNPGEEIALFQMCRSRVEAGQQAQAIEALGKLKERFPKSTYIARCERYIRTIQGER